MHLFVRPRRLPRRRVWILLALTFLASPGFAVTRTYFGPTGGSWNTGANWNPAGVPVGGDDVFLGTHILSPDPGNLDLNYNGSYSTGNPLNSLTLNSTGISGVLSLNQTSALSAMAALNEIIGLNVSGNIYNQGAGSNSVTNTLTLGAQANGAGTYNLFGSGVLNAGGIIVAGGGSGIFNQSGGTVNAGDAYVGDSTGTGVYTLTGGTLNLASVTVGTNGTFNLQTGGTLAGIFVVKAGGVFNLQGGTFATNPYVQLAGGTLRLNGNNLTATGLNATTGFVESNAGNGILTISTPAANLDVFSGTLRNGAAGTFALIKSGGGIQVLGGTNTYTGGTTVTAGTLRANSNGAFSAGSSYLIGSAGTLDVNGRFTSIASLSGNGTIALGAGSLTIGNAGNSAFSGPISGTGALVLAAVQVTLSGGGSFSGAISVQGLLAVGATDGLPVASAVDLVNIGSSLSVNFSQKLAAFSGSSVSTLNFQNNSVLTLGSGSTSTNFSGGFAGTGTLIKTGLGVFTIGLGTFDNGRANTATGIGFVVNSGGLVLDKADGTAAIGGALALNGGTLTLARGNQISNASSVTLTGGTLNLNGFNETIGGLGGNGGSINLLGGTLTVTQAADTSFAGALAGSGSLVKSGVGSLTLAAPAGFGGSFTVNAGRLILQGAANAGGYLANSGGILRFEGGAVSLGAGAIQAAPGGVVEYFNATLYNGFLRGAGSHQLLPGGTNVLNAITTFNSTSLTQTGATTFNNFNNGGTLTNHGPATINGGTNGITGVIHVNAALAVNDFSSSGVVNVNAGGTLTSTVSSLVFGGGSRTYLNAGGVLTGGAGTSIELNGGLLVNNGTINGTLNINYGGTGRGAGTFGIVNVGDGGVFSPGNSPGLATVAGLNFGAAGSYRFELSDTAAAAGVGRDFIQNLGTLAFTAGASPATRFRLELATLNASGAAGLALGFDATVAQDFTLVHSALGIVGFDPAALLVDASGFLNPTAGGEFSVLVQGNDLVLRFTPVPEPGTVAGILAGGALLGIAARCRRRQAGVSCHRN